MRRKRSLAEIHAAVLLFGIAGLFGKWIALPPVIIVLGRVFFATITLVFILGLKRSKFSLPGRYNYPILLSLGILLAVHWISFFTSIQISTVAVGLLSYSSFPVFTAFFEPLFFRERLERINIFFALLCVAGVYLIIPSFSLSNAIFRGVLWGLLSGLSFAILTLFNRKLSQKHSALVIAFYQDAFATVFLLPFFFFLSPALEVKNLILLILLGVFCTAFSHSLFIGGMRFVKAQTASVISSLEPVYGIILASILLGEVPSMRTIWGGVLILGTAFAVTLKAVKGAGR